MAVKKKQTIKEGELKSSPSPVFVRAIARMIYGGKTVFPGQAIAVTQSMAWSLIKAGLAEFGKPEKERAVLKPEEHR